MLTEDPADFRPNFDPLWILAVGDNDDEPQQVLKEIQCNYPRHYDCRSTMFTFSCRSSHDSLGSQDSFPGLHPKPRSQYRELRRAWEQGWKKQIASVFPRVKTPQTKHLLGERLAEESDGKNGQCNLSNDLPCTHYSSAVYYIIIIILVIMP